MKARAREEKDAARVSQTARPHARKSVNIRAGATTKDDVRTCVRTGSDSRTQEAMPEPQDFGDRQRGQVEGTVFSKAP